MDFATIFGSLAMFALLPIFWVPLIIGSLILWAFVVNERGGFAVLTTIVLGVLVAAKFPAIIAFITNPVYMLGAVLAYAVIGVLWSRYKWSNLLSNVAERFVELRDSFLAKHDLPKDHFKLHPDDNLMVTDFIKYYKDAVYNRGNSGKISTMQELRQYAAPQASKNKGSIVIWIAYWPMSVIWFIVADLVTEIGKALYRMVAGHFQKMSDSKFDSI